MSKNTKAHPRRLFILTLIFVLSSVNCAAETSKYGIIFTANLDGYQNIYRASGPNFNSLEQLTFAREAARHGARSLRVTRNGDQILFFVGSVDISDRPFDPHTYVLTTTTKTLIELSGLAFPPWLPEAWSIDEKQILLSEPSDGDVLIMNRNGTNIRRLSIPHIYASSIIEGVQYSPDGRFIVYEELNPNYQIGEHYFSSFIYDFVTEAVVPLNDPSADCRQPKWSPKGKLIAAVCNTIDSHYVSIFDVVDVNKIEKVSEFPQCSDQAWSPNGAQLVMVCLKDDTSNLFIVNSDGSALKKILASTLSGSSNLMNPIWTPDGKQILYISGTDASRSNIYLINSDGSNNHAITHQVANYQEMSVYPIR